MACNSHGADNIIVNEKKALKDVLLGVSSTDFHTVIDME